VKAARRYRVEDRDYIDRRVAAIEAAQLERPVRSVLRDPAARVTGWRHERIAYQFLNPSSGGIYRFAGTAESGGDPVTWALVLKVTRAAETLEHGSPVSQDLAQSMSEAVRWDRELLAYESGFLASLEGGLAAAAGHGGIRHDDDTCWLWLEDLGAAEQPEWSLGRWAVVGHALGAFNGAFLAETLPDYRWLGRQWLRVWVTQITPWLFGRSTAPGAIWEHSLVRNAYPDALRERLWAVWTDRETLLRAVEALPQTISHLDAHRRNLFLRGDELVAIDWGLLGLAAPGEEIASTLVGTIASGELPVDDAAAFASILYENYLAGLRDAGWSGDERDVRLAFTAAAALRSFSIVRLDVADDPQRPDDEAAAVIAGSAALAELLLDFGEEARTICFARA
jgi:hypothetical protein